jgi:hypothetical protein
MSNRKQRESNRANWRKLMASLKTNECSNCHELISGGHFVPPSFGEEGFFVCNNEEKSNERQQDRTIERDTQPV